MFRPAFVDHLVFRVAELERSERFYMALLGEPVYRTKDSVMYTAGDTRLFFSETGDDRRVPYDKERVGLNHLAFGVSSLQELQDFEAQLNAAGMTHSGITLDVYGQKEFIWLDDPDDMRIELLFTRGIDIRWQVKRQISPLRSDRQMGLSSTPLAREML